MSVHYSCDRIFEDAETLKRFKALIAHQSSGAPLGGAADGNNSAFQELKYHCPECRQNARAIQIQ